MRWAEKEKKKKNQSRIPFTLDPGKKIPKKIEKKKHQKTKKPSFQYYFQPKRDEIGRKREKKNLVPNSVQTQPGRKL